jgi:hypothetical protein|tara:strand:+ start:160 stop:498 length:339 start_codon:yes stop_codon:yes gene_type:complete
MSIVEKRVSKDGDKVKHMVMGLMAGIIISVVALEYNGYLRHSKEADSAMIEDFKLLTLKPGYDVKTSSKPSGKTAFCSGGSLLMRSDKTPTASGILVDKKGRIIKCDNQQMK